MKTRAGRKWMRTLLAAAGGGVLLQTTGCLVDPDLILQAAVQFFTEAAIFFTDAAFVSTL
jgi:hypothetical protein